MKVLALIPARGGSKGLPGKNLRKFLGLPLLAHSILCAKLISEVSRVVVSSDSHEILQVGADYGATDILRPPELSTDESPIWDTVKHTLDVVEMADGRYDYLVLLESTSPLRRPSWIGESLDMLQHNARADGVHGVSENDVSPIWNCLVEDGNGLAKYLIPEGRFYYRRQDVPKTYHMNGSLHIWRAQFVRDTDGGYHWGKHLMYRTEPSGWGPSIDTLEDFKEVERKGRRAVKEGLLEWIAPRPR